jgi:glycosyltransferase involved in cell wall biosynthesis
MEFAVLRPVQENMSVQPEISVVMPVYNSATYLAPAIDSILAQTFRDFEFIIINDGSTDGSQDILTHYASQDQRITVVNRENRGLVPTLNQAIGLAKSDLIARMDADDLSYPERFEKQSAFLRNNPGYVAVGCVTRLIDSEGDPLCSFSKQLAHDDIDASHLAGKGGAIVHPAAMFRKSAFDKIGGYRTECIHAEDVDLWLRLAEVGNLANLPDTLFDYRQHLQSVGHQHRARQIQSMNLAIQDARQRRGIAAAEPYQSSSIEPDPYQIALKWGWWALNEGNLHTATKYAFKVLKRNPFSKETLNFCACVLRDRLKAKQ